HPEEHAIRTGLRGQVQVRRDRSSRAEYLDELRVDERRMRRQESQAPDPGDAGRLRQERPESAAVVRVAVGVHGLAEQSHFRETLLRERLELGQHFASPPAALAAPREGNDAEGAELVAAFDDRDVGLKGGIAPDMPELIGGRVLRKIENNGPLPL